MVYPTGTSPAVQEAHPSHDGLGVPHLEVRCPHPRQEATGVTVQVSSPCCRCTPIWEFRSSPPHYSPNQESRLKVSCCRESLSSVIRQIFNAHLGVTQVAWSESLVRPGSTGQSRPTQNGDQVDGTNRVQRCLARHLSGTPTEVSSWFFLICKANARAQCKDNAWQLHQSVWPQSHNFGLQQRQSALNTQTAIQPKQTPQIKPRTTWALVLAIP